MNQNKVTNLLKLPNTYTTRQIRDLIFFIMAKKAQIISYYEKKLETVLVKYNKTPQHKIKIKNEKRKISQENFET